MARLLVAAVAAAIAGYFSGGTAAVQTFALVYGVTGFLDPSKKLLGPRLNDLKAPQASYGVPIAYIEGAPRLAGCVIYASNKREIATTQSQSKGGPGVDSTTFTYEMDLMVVLAINECQAIRRVFSNGKLVWGFSDDADDDTLAASDQAPSWRDIRFYNGNAAQLPDPTYEAAVGIGNAPAYRGRSTVFIEGLNLGGSGQVPVLTFEVLSEATATFSDHQITSVEQDGYWMRGIPAMARGGFRMLIGLWDAGSSTITSYDVYAVDARGHALFGTNYPTQGGAFRCATGNSDVSCLVSCGNGNDIYTCHLDDGSFVQYDCTGFSPGGHSAADLGRFSRVGNDVVMGGGGNRVIKRFDAAAGTLIATSAALSSDNYSVAIGGANVYVLRDNHNAIDVLDLATLTLQSTIAGPLIGNFQNGSVVCNSAGVLFLLGQKITPSVVGQLWKWNGAAWELLATDIGHIAADATNDSVSVDTAGSPGDFYVQTFVRNGAGLDPLNRAEVYGLFTRFATVDQPLDEVVSRLCLRTGRLAAGDIDVTDLAADVVHAMAISQVGATRTTLEMLMGAYLFECAEGETLKFVKRGGAAALSVPYADLGTSADGKAEPLPLNRLNDMEVPAQVSVKYANILNDFQDGLEIGDRLVTESTAVNVVEVPMGFTPVEAKRIADANTMDLAVSLQQIGPISLPARKYGGLEPTDVVTLVGADGSTFRARIVKATSSGGIVSFDLLLDDATVISSTVATDDDYESSHLVRLLADTDLKLLDIPILRDADDTPGFYAAFGAQGVWPGAELDVSPDDSSFTKVLSATDRAVVGTASGVLGDFTGGVCFDERNLLTVDVGDSLLSSVSRNDLLTSTANALLVGAEIIQFKTATLISPGVYQLSSLLRGRRGTEWAQPGHAAGETVVLLQLTGLRRVQDQQADIGIDRFWKAITFGTSKASTLSQAFTDTGVAVKPFSPVDIRVTKDAGGNLVVTWKRRTRLSTSFCGTAGISVPLGEASELYSIDIVNTGTGAVVRVLAATSETVTYTAVQQAADSISSASNIQFRVYQISASVGRGYAGTASAVGGRTPQAEIASITVGGAFGVGLPLYAIIDTTQVNLTTTSGHTNLPGVAAALGALIDALPVFSATVGGAVITVTAPVSTPFGVQVGLTGSQQMSTAAVQNAAPAGPGTQGKVIVGLASTTNPFSAQGGATYQLVLTKSAGAGGLGRRVTFRLPLGATEGASENDTITALVGQTPTTSDGGARGFYWSFEYGFGRDPVAVFDPGDYYDVSGYSSQIGVTVVASTVTYGTPPIAVDQAQITDFILPGSSSGSPTAGNVFRVTLAGVNFDYVVVGGDTYAAVLAGLIALITGGTYTASDSSAATGSLFKQLRVTAAVANVAFTYSGYLLPGQITLTAAITQQAV